MAEKVNISGDFVRSYEGVRGVDLNKDSGLLTKRFGYLENMYVDYEGGGEAVESIPGFRVIASLGKRINGIFSQSQGIGREYLIIHAGDKLYRADIALRDSLGSLTPVATVADNKSAAFSFGTSVFVLDGEGISAVRSDGTAARLCSEELSPYIPLLTRNGEEAEKRNLLTDLFRAEYFISSTEPMTYGTRELSYSILSDEDMTCTVLGPSENISGIVYIPSYAEIGGKKYRVTEIERMAFFGRDGITGVVTNRGLRKIGFGAFWNTRALTEAYISDTVEELEGFVFSGCTSLMRLYLGMKVKKLGLGVISGCTALSEVELYSEEADFAAIEGNNELERVEKRFNSVYDELTVSLPLNAPTSEVVELTLDGYIQPYTLEKENSRIKLTVDSRLLLEGHTVKLLGRLEGTFEERELILGCTVSELFDGRVFLSGNPACPGKVFYCGAPEGGEATPLYFPADCCFTDGVGGWGVTAMLSTRASLAVFKNGDDGSGSVFYHSANEGYPVVWSHGGVVSVGAARVFLDDALFLTDLGLFALEAEGGEGARSIVRRSEAIDPLLLSLGKSRAALTEWRGYLVLLAEGGMFLGDSRARGGGYDWYPLSGIGTYVGDRRIYRYAEIAPEGLSLSDTPFEIAEGEVYSEASATEGGLIYYTVRDGKRIAVYPTEEMTEGIFSPATAVLGHRELLFFGTECGDVCLFNNDLRGVAPERIRGDGFDAEEYRRTMGKRIHPDFYGFASHAPRYAVSFGEDRCELPYLTKTSLRGSLVAEIKNLGGKMLCEVGTDRGGYRRIAEFPAESMSFAESAPSGFSFDTNERAFLVIPEGERDWISKEITLYSEKYCSPFGVYALHYRYRVKGRIKNRN